MFSMEPNELQKKGRGRPETPEEVESRVRQLLISGAEIEAIKKATNLGKTKIYQIRAAVIKDQKVAQG